MGGKSSKQKRQASDSPGKSCQPTTEASDPVDTFTDTEEVARGFSELNSWILSAAPSEFNKGICRIIALYLWFDFEVQMNERMVLYKSCHDIDESYSFKSVFSNDNDRREVYCTPIGVTHFDMLIDLGFLIEKANPKTVADADEEQENQFLFSIAEFCAVSPGGMTAAVYDVIVWVFQKQPHFDDLKDPEKYNRRMDVEQLEFETGKGRNESHPIGYTRNPEIGRGRSLVSHKLPFGVVGRYVLFKCMSKAVSTRNIDIDHVGLRIRRL